MANTTTNKLGLFQRAGRFLRETGLELRKTSWPSQEELKKSTLLVLAAVAIITLWIGGLDYVFGVMTRQLVGW
jgi:preprotein translocase subunit SecE